MTDPEITQIALIVNAAGVLLVALGAFLAYRQIRTTQDWNRRKAAHDILFQAYLGEFRELRKHIESKIDIYDKSQNWSSVSSTLTEEDNLVLNAILNYLENICLAIKNNVVDESIMYDALHDVLCQYIRWSDPYISHHRRHSSPTVWIEMDPYVDKWNEQIRKTTLRLLEPGKKAL